MVEITTGLQVFRPVVFLIAESVAKLIQKAVTDVRYVCRYQNAIKAHPELLEFVRSLVEQYDRWTASVLGGQFEDALTGRDKRSDEQTFAMTRQELAKLIRIVEKHSPHLPKPAAPAQKLNAAKLSPAALRMIEQ